MWKFRLIAMTSLWARRRLKSPASRLFTQPFNQCAKQRKHQSSPSLAFRGIHRWPVNFPHKGPVTRKMFPFNDVIMYVCRHYYHTHKPEKELCRYTITTFIQIISGKVWFSTHSPDLLSTVSLSLLHNFYFNMLIILIFMIFFLLSIAHLCEWYGYDYLIYVVYD